MTGLDTNILIDLLVRSQPGHPQVRAWLEAYQGRLATTPVNIGEVLRLLTHPRVFPTPMRLGAAIDLFQHFLDEFDVMILEESSEWWQELRVLCDTIPSLRGNEVFDARIALCLRHNGLKEWLTRDTDFVKYPFLRPVKM